MKLSQKSAKNYFKMYPAGTVQEVFDNVVHSQEVQRCVQMSSCLVLRDWDYQVRRETEFRVFVVRRRVVCAS